MSAQTPTRWLLNMKTSDVVPSNPELEKRIPLGDFRRITAAEAQRRLNPPARVAQPEPEENDDTDNSGRIIGDEEEEEEEEVDLPPPDAKAKKVKTDPLDALGPDVKEQILDALKTVEGYRVADDQAGLDLYAKDSFGIKLDKRRNITKMVAEFKLKLGDTFGVKL